MRLRFIRFMAEGNDIKRLVIVESTTKAKKIAPYLGSNYIGG